MYDKFVGLHPTYYKPDGRFIEMENDNMTQTELVAFLHTIAENIRLKAKTAEEAAAIIEEIIQKLK